MNSGVSSIAVCSKGNPRSPQTWSGTPANLCRAIEELGASVVPIDCSAPALRILEFAVKALSKIYYLNSRYARLGEIERPWRERRAVRRVNATRTPPDVLHLYSVVHVPSIPAIDCRRRHYVLMDTTWRLWRRYSTDMANVSSRLTDDVMRFEREFVHRATHCFPLSQYVRRDLIDHYEIPPDRITVVGTGRGAIKPYFGPKNYNNGSILFVANKRFADKGGDRLLEAFVRARQRNANLRLTIVGRAEYQTQFAGIPGVVTYGRIPLEELQQLFNQASLFALPAAFEPWGLVYLEALACRVPVLGLRHHALPEITRNGRYGFCLEDGGVEEIARILIQAFEQPELLAKMGAEGQQHCLANFTWEKTARRILDTIDKIKGESAELPTGL